MRDATTLGSAADRKPWVPVARYAAAMPLLLLDLDNTLVDRAAAYRAWAASYLEKRGASPDLLGPMIAADGDGLRYKPDVAADLADILGLTQAETESIVRVLRAGVLEHLVLVPGCVEALRRARAAGWTPFVLTNGVVAQQESKIRNLGLDAEVDGWVISDAVGVRKPDPAIYRLAAEASGLPLESAWIIGDAADTDILGAHRAGIHSVYLHRGRAWDDAFPRPTAEASSLTEAVRIVVESGE